METKVTHVQSAASYLPSGSSAAAIGSGSDNNCPTERLAPIVRTPAVTLTGSNVEPFASGTSAYSTATFQTKNKRKNFNPRCSASADEEDGINQPEASESMTSDPFDAARNESASINWRKLQLPPPPPHDSQSDMVGSTSEFGELHTNQFYNIPNTNFSIAKSMAATGETAPGTNDLAAAGSRTAATEHSSTARFVTEMASAAHAVNSPQARLELTCNALNAVKDVINKFGLSISPSDIVEAFKKQAIGECILCIFYLCRQI